MVRGQPRRLRVWLARNRRPEAALVDQFAEALPMCRLGSRHACSATSGIARSTAEPHAPLLGKAEHTLEGSILASSSPPP
jgi:hypothetical protein